MNEIVYAKHKYARISAKKMAIVMDLVRGKNTIEAQRILKFDPTKGAKLLLKVLNSAIANAENNKNMKKEEMFLQDVRVDGGPSFKRAQFIGKGRVNPLIKRTSHIVIGLTERKGK